MKDLPSSEKIWKWLLGFFLLNLLLRLAFISWHPAVYTDSVYYMTALERVEGTFILPGYPFFLRLLKRVVGDPLIAGRLTSIIAGALGVLPLIGIARIVSGKRAAIFSAALYTVSPLIFRWSLRIFPHSLYALFVLLCVYGIFKCAQTGNGLFLGLGIFSGGLAALTYPTGLVLVPPAAAAAAGFFIAALFREKKVKAWLIVFPLAAAFLVLAFFFLPGLKERLQSVLGLVLSVFPVSLPGPILLWQGLFSLGALAVLLLGLFYLLPRGLKPWSGWWLKPLVLLMIVASFSAFAFLHVWQKYLAKSDWYQEGMRTSWRSLGTRGTDWLVHYLYSYPWILTYPVALLAVIGFAVIVVRARRHPLALIWAVFSLYFFASITVVLVINKWWTPRYQYELVPAGLIFAGVGIDAIFSRRKLRRLGIAALVICLLSSAVFTGLVLRWSRDSFADISRLSLYVRDRFPGRTIYTDETLKAIFFANRPLRGYTTSTRGNLKTGDLGLLPGWHTNLETDRRFRTRLLDLEIVIREEANI
ncbi:MAG: glycosyltransferase family 39 protein, partial [Candidatus Aureabacteria bacterium]|nr:glycosyltransferase family 39 protein [Candidatus Auribacterota bacterium]